MDNKTLLEVLALLEPVLCVVALIAIYRRRVFLKFQALSAFLIVRCVSSTLGWLLLHFAGDRIGKVFAYQLYFGVYWLSYAVESALSLYILYELYRLAMAPLPGLQRLGRLMFRWAAVISIVVALGLACEQGAASSASPFIVRVVSQLQQTQSILTLCLLTFVTFAIRPMGLSYRSKIFGISLGLGVLATSDLCTAALFSNMTTMNSLINYFNAFAFLLTACIWTAYFIVREPKRRMILLPTTSPFHRWNQISLALGDSPGYALIGELDPDVFAPAEVEIMRRASRKMEPAAIQ